MSDDALTPTERLLARRSEHEDRGHRLDDRARQSQRSLEGYLQAGSRPRWMERLGEIEQRTATHRRRLERRYVELREQHGDTDPEGFARAWRALVDGWDFSEVNELIGQHNEWFPIERRLAVDPRTLDYVRINGRSYRRAPLGPGWALEQFPAG